MNNNNSEESRESRYRSYRQDIDEDKRHDDEYVNDRNQNFERKAKAPRRKKRHYGRWFLAVIIVILLFFGFETVHQINELGDMQRQTDTTLDKIIKNQGKEIAKKQAPQDVKPQIIKIISNTPLSELQRAADDETLFNQLAQQNNVPNKYIQAAQREWFTPANQTVRNAIKRGNLWAIYNSIENGGVDPSFSSDSSNS